MGGFALIMKQAAGGELPGPDQDAPGPGAHVENAAGGARRQQSNGRHTARASRRCAGR
jgi:hypothetical protein